MWNALDELDLSGFYVEIEAREGSAGRPVIDPRILVGLWLYATIEGVGSARDVARLCELHNAYRWMCGGVGVNHHTLIDFRVDHGPALDDLMTQILGALLHEGAVGMRRVAQDGMKVRAKAGAASFWRNPSLKACLRDAGEQVRNVKRLLHAEEARASTSDPKARAMKMADGGFRPAYNIQIATDVEARVIVRVTVTNQGNDFGQIEPMLREIGRRTERLPKELLVDGGYRSLASIERAEAAGVKVYAPLMERKNGKDPSRPKPSEGPGVAAWRERMAEPISKEIDKDRASTAERTNADLRCRRGLDSIPVQGIGKALCVALWSALAFNLMRCAELGVL